MATFCFRTTIRHEDGIEEFDVLCECDMTAGSMDSWFEPGDPPELNSLKVDLIAYELNPPNRVSHRLIVDMEHAAGPWGEMVYMRWKQIEREYEDYLQDAAYTHYANGNYDNDRFYDDAL